MREGEEIVKTTQEKTEKHKSSFEKGRDFVLCIYTIGAQGKITNNTAGISEPFLCEVFQVLIVVDPSCGLTEDELTAWGR